MNPFKCFFGVSLGKFLGFVVRKGGIKLDPVKVKAILEMPPPKTLKSSEVYRVDWLTSGDSSLTYLGSAYLSLA